MKKEYVEEMPDNCKLGTESIGSKTLGNISRTEIRANDLINELNGKLNSILTQSYPTCEPEEKENKQDYPVYFDELRDTNQRLNNSLDLLESIIDRIAL